MKIVLTGAAGFLGHYLITELLAHGHHVIGVDDFSRYGVCDMSQYDATRFQFVCGDVCHPSVLPPLLETANAVIAAAASVGGVGHVHAAPHTLFSSNMRMNLATLDAALAVHQRRPLQRYVCVSTSMVYESTTQFPTPEDAAHTIPPPRTTYGMEKLAAEYAVRAAATQYQLPYTIVRPHNAVGVGRPLAQGSSALARHNVIPALLYKILRGNRPVELIGDGAQVRCFTAAADIARGIRLALESPQAINQAFNIAHATPHSIRRVAELLWDRICPDHPYNIVGRPALPNDVAYSHPDTRKASSLLHFRADTPLTTTLDAMVDWVRTRVSTSHNSCCHCEEHSDAAISQCTRGIAALRSQ